MIDQSCNTCRYEHNDTEEAPCNHCTHNAVDNWREKIKTGIFYRTKRDGKSVSVDVADMSRIELIDCNDLIAMADLVKRLCAILEERA